MPVLVGLHLRESQHRVLTLLAVVVSLLPVVRAPAGVAELGGRVLLEAGGHDGVQLLVLPPVGHHLVGVGAVIVALEAVKVTRALLGFTGQRDHWNKKGKEKALLPIGTCALLEDRWSQCVDTYLLIFTSSSAR